MQSTLQNVDPQVATSYTEEEKQVLRDAAAPKHAGGAWAYSLRKRLSRNKDLQHAKEGAEAALNAYNLALAEGASDVNDKKFGFYAAMRALGSYGPRSSPDSRSGRGRSAESNNGACEKFEKKNAKLYEAFTLMKFSDFDERAQNLIQFARSKGNDRDCTENDRQEFCKQFDTLKKDIWLNSTQVARPQRLQARFDDLKQIYDGMKLYEAFENAVHLEGALNSTSVEEEGAARKAFTDAATNALVMSRKYEGTYKVGPAALKLEEILKRWERDASQRAHATVMEAIQALENTIRDKDPSKINEAKRSLSQIFKRWEYELTDDDRNDLVKKMVIPRKQANLIIPPYLYGRAHMVNRGR